MRQLVGLQGILGVLLDGAGQFLHRGGGLFQGTGLLLGARGQVHVAGGDFLGIGVDAVGTAAHARHRRQQCLLHAADGREQATDLVLAFDVDLGGQVAIGHQVQQVHGAIERREHDVAQHEVHADDQEHGTDETGHDQPHHQVVFTLAFGGGLVVELHRTLLVDVQRGREARAPLADEVVVELRIGGGIAALEHLGGLLQDLVQGPGRFDQFGLGGRILSLQIGQFGVVVQVFETTLVGGLGALEGRVDHGLVALFHQGRIDAGLGRAGARGVLVGIIDQQGALGDLMHVLGRMIGPAQGKDTDRSADHDHARKQRKRAHQAEANRKIPHSLSPLNFWTTLEMRLALDDTAAAPSPIGRQPDQNHPISRLERSAGCQAALCNGNARRRLSWIKLCAKETEFGLVM